MRSQVRELTAQIQSAVREGERIRRRLGASLRGTFGFDSEVLVKYGFKPLPAASRRRPKAKPAPEVVGPNENRPAGFPSRAVASEIRGES